MNREKFIVGVLLALLSVKAFPQSVTLDEAIKTTATELGQQINANKIPTISSSNQSIEQTAEEIRRQLTAQTKIAVLNFSSDWRELSSYVIEELNAAIGRGGSLTVVNRQQLGLLEQELDFQESYADDKSAQSKGKLLGAQSVLTGSFTVIGKNMYRFRVRVIAVETGVEQYSNSIEIKTDRVLTALTSDTKGGQGHKEPIKVRPLANFSAGIGGGNFSGILGILLPVAGFQAGVAVNTFNFLLDVNGALGYSLTDSSSGFFYNLGGLIEYRIADVAVLGAGGGIGGLNDYSYPYIRGFAAALAASYVKIGFYYDYNFDYGFNVGLRIYLYLTNDNW
jgi:TolB-like protein